MQSAGGWKLSRRNTPRKEKSTTLGAYSSPEQLKSAVLHDGYHDATLGLTPPDFATLGAQTGSAPTEVLLAVLGAHSSPTPSGNASSGACACGGTPSSLTLTHCLQALQQLEGKAQEVAAP